MSLTNHESIQRGQAALTAYAVARSRKGYPTLVGKTRKQYELLRAITVAPASIYQPVMGEAKKNAPTAMITLAGILTANWNRDNGYAWPSHATLREISGLKQAALEAASNGLREAGLFGIVQGRNGATSHYYPLFHQESRVAFSDKLNQLRAGLIEDDEPILISGPDDVNF